MTTLTIEYFLYYFLVVNMVAYIIYFYDKKQAISEKKRISENTLLLFVLAGGILGSAISMIINRHKTRKFSFVAKFLLTSLLFIFFVYYSIVKS